MTEIPHGSDALGAALAVCIPTYGRPEMVRRLLENLAVQERLPDEVLVVDASLDGCTAAVCAELATGVPYRLRHLRAQKGLTKQRNVGIDASEGPFLCMLDDDVLLDPPFLRELMASFEGDREGRLGGLSGYITNEFGVLSPNWFHKLLHVLGFLPKELLGGTYLPWGYAVELAYLPPFSGTVNVDFLPGGCTLWRREVFDHFRPNEAIRTYGGEDKELSMRVATEYSIALCGGATLRHDHVSGGARRHPFWGGFFFVRNFLFILDACRPSTSWWRRIQARCYFCIESARLVLIGAVRCSPPAVWRGLGEWVGLLWFLAAPVSA